MNIGVLGSGMVGQNLGRALAGKGHAVVLGTRTPDELDRERGDQPSLRSWLRDAGDSARVGSFAAAAAHGDVVLNATSGKGSLEALERAGEDALRGKILIDISNPLDFSRGMPPTLTVCNDDSLGEQIQRALPETRVVKALNTLTTALMTDPGQVNGGDHTLFICGDDADAKAQVRAWLGEWFGHRDVLDLGPISAARGIEMVLPLWIRIMQALGTPMFQFRIVR